MRNSKRVLVLHNLGFKGVRAAGGCSVLQHAVAPHEGLS
jgi:hypothetical protein